MYFMDSAPGRTCIIDGKEYLFFSGYSYLGMNHVEAFREIVKEGIDKYGILFPSSRISNTRLSIYDYFEEHLSKMTGTDETVSFSSGYLASKTISEILSSHKNIYVAPGSHPSVVPGPGSRESEAGSRKQPWNFNEWKNEITNLINSSEEKEFVLIADSVNVMTSEINDPSLNITKDKKVTFLLDDSHGIGLINDGTGIAGQTKNSQGNIEYMFSYSLSKAFNIPGGAVSCSKHWASKLREHPNYSGSTAMSPAFIHAFLKSKELYHVQRKRLMENVHILNEQNCEVLTNKNDLPVFICNNEHAEKKMAAQNIIISSFSYPFPDSPKINRIVLNALHTREDIMKISGVTGDHTLL